METLLKADIFFTITSVAVVLIALVAIIALVYVVLILRELRGLMRSIREEGQNIVGDVRSIREAIENQGWRMKEFVDSIGHGVLRLAGLLFRSSGRRGKGKGK